MSDKPREIWIMSDLHSNRALFRTDAEKYPGDVDGKPGEGWEHFIEYSAYEAVCKERDEWIGHSTSNRALVDKLRAELEQLKNYSGETDARLTEAWERVKSLEIVKKQEESFFKQRNELQADLAVAVEALEFYGTKTHWKSVTIEDTNRKFCILSTDLEYFQNESQNSFCGKRAREALSKIKDGK